MTDPIRMTIDKARRILASCQSEKYDEPISGADIMALAQAFIDHKQAIMSLEGCCDQLEQDNRTAIAKLAELEAMVGRVEREAGL